MTRILSVFKILKRVGFAVFVLEGGLAFAQTYVPIWTYEFGESGSDVVNDLISTSDNCVLLAIQSDPDSGETGRAVLAKLDQDGELLWRQEYREDSMGFVKAVIEAEDGGYILVGSGITNWQPQYIVKTDSIGHRQWSRYYNIHPGDWLVDGVRSTAGGYVLLTRGGSGNSADATLLWIDSNGNILRNRSYGGSNIDWASEIAELPDHEYVFALMRSDTSYSRLQPWAGRIDSAGTLIWERFLGTEEDEWVNTITITENHGSIIAGCRDSHLHEPQVSPFAAAVSPDGDSLWMHIWDDQEGCIFRCRRVGTDYVLVGNTQSEESGTQSILIIRTSEQGERLCTQVFDTETAEQAYSLCELSDRAFVVGGWRWNGNSHGWDAFATSFEVNTNVLTDNPVACSERFDISIAPNPLNANAVMRIVIPQASHVDVTLYDLLGRVVTDVLSQSFAAGTFYAQFDATNISSGIYFVRLHSIRGGVTKKLAIIR